MQINEKIIKKMQKDLTKDKVGKNILRLALPIIGSSFMHLAYNFVDMLWVGKLGSGAVAAVGTSGFFMHLGWAFASIILVGTGITVAQLIGKKQEKKAKFISVNGWVGVLALTSLFIIAIQLFYENLIGFFNMDSNIEEMAHSYLRWASSGLLMLFTVQLLTKISNARGDSQTPFRIGIVGIVLNIILDPIFIFTLNFGIVGAAWASLLSQSLVVTIFLIKRSKIFFGTREEFKFSFQHILKLAKIGLPPSIQYMMFSGIAIIMAKIVSGFGGDAIAAQKIGHQIEAITFTTVGGLSGALMSFTGQNFGARLFARVREGYWAGIRFSVSVGVIMTITFLTFSEQMVGWFVTDLSTIAIGSSYLIIIGISQIFMVVDITASGIMNGMGKTRIPATISIVMILIRVPLALYLSQEALYGINGVWLAILISTVLRGLATNTAYHIIKNKVLFIK